MNAYVEILSRMKGLENVGAGYHTRWEAMKKYLMREIERENAEQAKQYKEVGSEKA